MKRSPGEKKVSIRFRLYRDELERIQELAEAERRTVQNFIALALDKRLAEVEPQRR